MTLRRSMLFLPGANAAMLSTAFVFRYLDDFFFDASLLDPRLHECPFVMGDLLHCCDGRRCR